MTRILLLLCLAAVWMTETCYPAERRVALVVGAANYAHAPALAHTLDDARDMAAALKRLGFEVDLVLNPDRAGLESSVRRLGQKSRGADATVFYYSGHALELQGINWVLPVSADVQSDRDLRFEALDLSVVLEQVEGLARVSLIFLDACREDPFKQRLGVGREVTRSGLATVNATASGTYLAFATAPGMVAADGNGAHSPFTGALLKYIETPSLEVRQLLSKVRAAVEEATDNKQIPWDSSSLKGDFYFNPVSPGKLSEKAIQAINSQTPQVDLDALFWESVDKKSPADLNAYLLKFPQGTFVELARNRLVELKAKPVAPPSPPNPKLLDALSIAQAVLSPKVREGFAAGYQVAKEHKAIAGYLANGQAMRVADRQSAQEAEESGLEACEVYAGAPCVLIAVDDNVTFASDSLPRTMPRVHYVGAFDPDRVPSVPQGVRKRPDVVGYLSAPNSKAAAYHPSGKLFIATDFPNQHDAEEQALSLCNDDSTRGGQGGPCFLYASNNEVVLSRRSKTPITAATVVARTEVAKPPPVTPPPTNTVTFHDALAAQLERLLPALGPAQRNGVVKNFEESARHRALALHSKDSGAWRFLGWPTPESAEEAALEGCQAYYGEPCTLLAVDDVIRADGAPAMRDMPRVHYEGTFNVEQIPAIPVSVRNRADVLSYAAAPTSKAVAFHPWGQIYIVTGAKSKNEAETNALAACNGDQIRKGQGGPCYLYASGDQVVFAKRLRLPMTSAASPTQIIAAPPPISKPVTTDDAAVMDLLLNRLKGRTEKMAKDSRLSLDNTAQTYLSHQATGHRAIAVGSNSTGYATVTWSFNEPTVQGARNLALERCQVNAVEPCTLIAVDHDVAPAPTDGKWSGLDMPRVHYEGLFDLNQIPGLSDANRNRPEAAAYDHAPPPKAATIDDNGNIFFVSGAISQTDAEGQALAKCGKTVCYLYAVGNQVVLSNHWTKPRPLGNSLSDVLSYAMVPNAAKIAGDFNTWPPHKSMALFPEQRATWGFDKFASGESAEQIALEACGLKYNAACIVLATDDRLVNKDPSSGQRLSMPRLTYQGQYRPEMVPLFPTPPKLAQDYAKMHAPKAMAIFPSGLRITAETGATLAEAQTKALAKCTDPASPFPCFLYAVNNNVILPLRRTEPMP